MECEKKDTCGKLHVTKEELEKRVAQAKKTEERKKAKEEKKGNHVLIRPGLSMVGNPADDASK